MLSKCKKIVYSLSLFGVRYKWIVNLTTFTDNLKKAFESAFLRQVSYFFMSRTLETCSDYTPSFLEENRPSRNVALLLTLQKFAWKWPLFNLCLIPLFANFEQKLALISQRVVFLNLDCVLPTTAGFKVSVAKRLPLRYLFTLTAIFT